MSISDERKTIEAVGHWDGAATKKTFAQWRRRIAFELREMELLVPRWIRPVLWVVVGTTFVIATPFRSLLARVWQRRRSVRIIAEFNRRWAESAEDATRFLHDAYDIAGTGCAFHEYGTLPIYVKGELLRIVFDAELSLGRPEQALALVTDCAGLAPDYAAPYVMRARCLFEMGQLDKAVAELQRGLPYDERGQIAESLEHLRIQRIDIGRPS